MARASLVRPEDLFRELTLSLSLSVCLCVSVSLSVSLSLSLPFFFAKDGHDRSCSFLSGQCLTTLLSATVQSPVMRVSLRFVRHAGTLDWHWGWGYEGGGGRGEGGKGAAFL